jgi:hypothetical protein
MVNWPVGSTDLGDQLGDADAAPGVRSALFGVVLRRFDGLHRGLGLPSVQAVINR